MPLTKDVLGTDAGGCKNKEYCMNRHRRSFLPRFLSLKFCN
ncbi:MAG: hypothetical protein KIG78_04130 [Bacteroidaceae bacterium]|nr:hypothetical protein [Bacteroidaceae bacterium]